MLVNAKKTGMASSTDSTNVNRPPIDNHLLHQCEVWASSFANNHSQFFFLVVIEVVIGLQDETQVFEPILKINNIIWEIEKNPLFFFFIQTIKTNGWFASLFPSLNPNSNCLESLSVYLLPKQIHL